MWAAGLAAGLCSASSCPQRHPSEVLMVNRKHTGIMCGRRTCASGSCLRQGVQLLREAAARQRRRLVHRDGALPCGHARRSGRGQCCRCRRSIVRARACICASYARWPASAQTLVAAVRLLDIYLASSEQIPSHKEV